MGTVKYSGLSISMARISRLILWGFTRDFLLIVNMQPFNMSLIVRIKKDIRE